MLEQYYTYPRVLDRLRGGSLGSQMDQIAAHFLALGYKPSSVKIFLGHLSRFSHFAGKFCKNNTSVIAESVVDHFLRTRPTLASRVGARTAMCHARQAAPQRFAAFRRPPVLSPDGQFLAAYESYLLQIRGLQPKTCEGLMSIARRVLAWLRDARRGLPLSGLNGKHVLALVQEFLSKCSNDYTRSSTTAYLRTFLRYLRWAGLNRQDLSCFVPRTPCWRLPHLPARVAWEDVRRAIDLIDTRSAIGARDRALLLLIATTGLRSKELRRLELSDIRWRTGEVLLRQTKAQRDRVVPLLEETGAALANYVLHARPTINSPNVFLIHTAPVRPFRYASTISWIVRCRLRRGGVKLSRGGAHLLRHCLATHLVSESRPINEVADLLGHRNIDTTSIYIKVALPQLAAVALPFPGGAA
jgi:integrase